MEEPKKEKEKKPFNVVLLGNIESEKAALLHKFIKKRFAIKQLQEINISNENGEEDSNIDEIMNNVEIHGETVRMKIWDNVSANKIFSSSNKSLKVAQGIILFYSVANRKSFNMLKLSLSNIIDLDKYDIPMIMVGNDSETQNREVSYEEAKALADSYGINFYETSVKSGMNKIFEDIGEQVFYHEYGDQSNNVYKSYYNSNSNYVKNKYNLSTSKSTKNINTNKISIYSKNDFYENDFNNKLKNKIGKNISLFSLSRAKSNMKKNNNKSTDKKNTDGIKSDDDLNINLNLDDSIHSFQNNNNSIKLRNKSNKNKTNKNSLLLKSPDIFMNSSSILNNSSSIIFSEQNNKKAQKKREEEIREKRLKREKEMKIWWKKREKENLEKNKMKKLKEKEELQKKTKQDKINQKEKEKKTSEENYNKIKNNYEKKKKSIKESEIMTNKENKKNNNMLEKKSNKEKLNKMKEEKEEKILLNNRNAYNKNKKNNIRKGMVSNKSDDNFNKHKNTGNKLRGKNNNIYQKNKNKSEKKHKNNNESLNNSIITQDEQELIKQNFEIKNKLIENYQNHSDIYRCLKCQLIPNILINEYNQEIEAYCDKSYNDISHHNITSYSNFQDLSLNHPIDNNNILCHYCNKSINELSSEQTIYYCSLCDIYFCSEDDELHKDENHKSIDDLKQIYLEISKNNQKIIASKNINSLNTPSQNKKTKTKTLNKQNSTPLLLKKNNNNNNKKLASKKNIIQQTKPKNTNINTNTTINNSLNSSNLNNSLISNSLILLKEKKKNKNCNKIQIHLIDTYCNKHNEIYKSYCFNCHKNICEICEEQHIGHKNVKFDEIILDEEELIEKKNELNKAKEELMKIKDYFSALIEAIKCKFERLFNIKKKELEIKEKIIKDYETIKYNYQCINNIRNIKFENNKTFFDKSNNTEWFQRFNLIFKYLNSDLNIQNNNNDIFDLLNNRTEKNNIKIISNKNTNEDAKNNDLIINKLIVLKNEDIGICINNNIIIYDKENLNEKLNIKNNENENINDFFEKNENTIVCYGHKSIKFINLSLNNKHYDIIKSCNLCDKKSNIDINSIVELDNNLFISSNNIGIIQLWKIDKFYLIKCIDSYNYDDLKEDNNLLIKINNNSFIFSSFKKSNLSLFKINNYEKIELEKNIQDIKIIKGKNTIIKFQDEDILLISCVECDNKNNYYYEEENNEDINNNFYCKGEYFIKIIDINNFNIIGKYKNSYMCVDIKYYINNIIIALDSNGTIHKIEYDKYQKNLISLDEIKYNNDFILDNEKIKGINIDKNRKSLILELNNKIVKISNLD